MQYQIAKLFVAMLQAEIDNKGNSNVYRCECMLVMSAVKKLMRFF